jgi:hypothetical protein
MVIGTWRRGNLVQCFVVAENTVVEAPTCFDVRAPFRSYTHFLQRWKCCKSRFGRVEITSRFVGIGFLLVVS